ncbi:MAG: hypothetical protein NTV93_06100 [Verrucomicrobia bacterium]|nr:hypothetical protein [Verrucomicrobiota bacterium]
MVANLARARTRCVDAFLVAFRMVTRGCARIEVKREKTLAAMGKQSRNIRRKNGKGVAREIFLQNPISL